MKVPFKVTILALFIFIASYFFQEFSIYANGIVPKEDFTITPKEGKYHYPENISFKKGKEYITLGETKDSYIIKYEMFEGIFEKVHVPKNKMEYLEEPKTDVLEKRGREAIEKAKALRKKQREAIEKAKALGKKQREAIEKREALREKQREAIEKFEKEQRAKGLVKVGNFWITKANAELWSEYVKLTQLRAEIINLEKHNKKVEAELTGFSEYITKLKNSVVSLQQQLNYLEGWLGTQGLRITKWSPQYEIENYNSKVMKYNMLKGKISKTKLKQKKAQMYCEEKAKMLTHNNEKCQAKKSEYIKKFSRFEPLLMNRLSNTQNNQKKFLSFIAENIQLLSRELKFNVVEIHKYGEEVFVKGTINNKLDTEFMINTEATYIAISKSMANELQLNVNSKTPREDIQMADGSLQNVPVITLSSVSIGEVRKDKVKATVVEDSPNFTPLLGMSFLKHFNWHFEDKNKIVFETLEFSDIEPKQSLPIQDQIDESKAEISPIEK